MTVLRRHNLLDFEADLETETEKAWRLSVYLAGGEKESVWLPKSQCEFDRNTNQLTLESWLAEEKGLI